MVIVNFFRLWFLSLLYIFLCLTSICKLSVFRLLARTHIFQVQSVKGVHAAHVESNIGYPVCLRRSEYTKSDGLLWKQMAKINDDKTKINTRKTQQTNKHSTQSLFRYFENIPQFVSCINVKCAFLKMPHIHDVEAMLSLRQLYGKLYQWDPFITLKTFVDAGCVSFAIVRISNMLLHTQTIARQYPLEFLLAKIISCCVSLKSNNYLIESSITRTIDFIGSD